MGIHCEFSSINTIRKRECLSLRDFWVMGFVGILLTGLQTGHAQTLTWDASGANPTAPTDGSGFWDTSAHVTWTDGTNSSVWINGDAATIGNNNGSAGTITIDEPGLTASGVAFNPAISGDYTIAASPSNTLILSSTAAINVATGLNPTISAPIDGTAGLNLTGPGTLNLTGANVFTGPLVVNSGTLAIGTGGNLGAATNGLTLGTTATANLGNFSLASGVNATIGNFISATNTPSSSAANIVTLNSGSTLNINSAFATPTGLNAVFLMGSATDAAPTSAVTTNVTITGGGTLTVSGGVSNSSFLIGVGYTAASGVVNTPTLDMSGLANFTFSTGTGAAPGSAGPGGNEFAVGVGSTVAGTVLLAQNSTITAGTIDIGDSTVTTPGSTVTTIFTPAPGTAKAALDFGTGTNTLNANLLQIGAGKTTASIGWASSTGPGTLLIDGATGGTSKAIITFGTVASTGSNGSGSSFDLSGHSVTVQASTVTVGQLLSGSAANGNGTSTGSGGTLTFDTGTFNADTVQLAIIPSTSTATIGSGKAFIGIFNLGKGSGATGVLNASSFIIANNASSIGPASGLFNIKGGTANIANNIVDISTGSGASATTLVLSGGTLNMEGFAIGPVNNATGMVGKRHITTITLPTLGNSAVLENLGSTGINDAGLTMNGTGVLILDGTNTYTGNTTISAGTLQVGQASDTVSPSGALQASVTDNGTLAFGSSQPLSVSTTVSGTGGVLQNGAGTTSLTGNNSYAGVTTLAAGVLSTASLPDGGLNSPIGKASNAATNILLSGGTLQYAGTGGTTNRLFSVTPTGGAISSAGTGAINFNNGGSIVSSDAAARTGALSTTSPKVTLANVYDLVVGMTVTDSTNPGNLPAGTTILSINAAANSVTLSNTPTGATTDSLNFSAVPRTLTLTGTNTGANTIGDLLGNSTGGGALSIVKSGVGNWTLSTPNTYTGSVTVNAGTLTLGATNTYSGATTLNGGTLALGVANTVAGATHSNVVLNGGTLATGGLNQTLGTLQVVGNSTINVGGGTNTLSFDNSGAVSWTPGKLLSITNWNGNPADPTAGGGPDQVKVGSTNTGLLTQLNQIKFDNYKSGAQILPNGEIVPASSTIILPGDFNFDGHTNAADIQPMMVALTDLSDFQINHGLSDFDMTSLGDFTADNKINNADLQGLLNFLLNGASSTSAVPEPTTFALLAFALPGIWLLGHRRASNAA